MRVLFWGTPDFATPALRALIGEGFDVVGVVTQPDKPVGRSRSSLQSPPVKKVALAEGIQVLQPERPTPDAILDTLRSLEPDISVVVAYGHILAERIIQLPRHGTLNIHASLLPKLRGAAPIQAAIREGFTETGVSIMQMVRALDAGPVLLQVKTPIPEDETYGELSLRLAEMGALALIEALALVELGKAVPRPQDESQATYAPKISREVTGIDWTMKADRVAHQIRAFDPAPGARAQLDGTEIKLFGATVVKDQRVAHPGVVGEITADGMLVGCGSGAVWISAMQPSGKRRMTPAECARGRGIAVGARLS